MFYTLPAESAQRHRSMVPAFVPDELHLLLSRTETEMPSSVWSVDHKAGRRLSSRVLHGIKRIATRANLRSRSGSSSTASPSSDDEHGEHEDQKAPASRPISVASTAVCWSSDDESNFATADDSKAGASRVSSATSTASSENAEKRSHGRLHSVWEAIGNSLGAMCPMPLTPALGVAYGAYPTPTPIFW